MKNLSRKALSLLLSLVMILTLVPATALAQGSAYSDTANHWAEDAIAKWSSQGVLSGYAGSFRPNDPITRAELATALDKVMKYQTVANKQFSDVSPSAWYYNSIMRLYAAGIMSGVGNNLMQPERGITREEAAVMIARAFKVPENAGNENLFPDAGNISGWASFLVDGMKAAGYISGRPDGNFDPKATITRAEVVTILDNMVDHLYHEKGEYDNKAVSFSPTNVVINTSGVTLKNTTITRNLYLTQGIGSGEATLNNVTAKGITYIWGGGPNSVIVTGGELNIVEIDSLTNTTLKLSDTTNIKKVYINNDATVTHKGMTVTYDSTTKTLTFGGTIDKVELRADGSVTVTVGGVTYDIIPPEGAIAKFTLAEGCVVKEMVLYSGVHITGTGTINKLEVHADGTVIDKSVKLRPEDTKVDSGVKVKIGDKEYTGNGGYSPKTEAPSGGSGSSGSGSSGSSGSSGYTSPYVYSVTVSPAALTVTVGTATGQQLVATVSVTGGAAQTVTWSVFDAGTTGAGKVTVTNDGRLNVAADASAGTAIIRATSTVNSAKYGECVVTVGNPPLTPTVTGVTVSPAALTVTVGTATDQQLVANVSVTDGAAQTVTWSVHDAGTTGVGKVTVTADGKLSVAADATEGTAIIRATSTEDSAKYGECTVMVNPVPTYSITMTNDGNGTADANPASAAAGTNITIIATPNNGYRFKQWVVVSGNMALSSEHTPSATFTMPGNAVAIRAEFEAVFTVNYDVTANSGTGAVLPVSCLYGATANAEAFTGVTPPTNCDIYRWNTQPGGGGTWYAPGATLPIPAVPGGTSSITLYAIYSARSSSFTNGLTVVNGTLTVANQSATGDIVVPSVVDGVVVTNAVMNAFNTNAAMTSIVLPDTIQTLGTRAFGGCTALQSVTLPNTLTTVEAQTFQNCTVLTSINLPTSLQSIGDGAFLGCNSLQSITLPGSLQNIGNSAFQGCNLTGGIEIPASVTSVGELAFRGNRAITTVTFLGNKPTALHANTFWLCDGITNIYYMPGATGWVGTEVFDINNTPTKITVELKP